MSKRIQDKKTEGEPTVSKPKPAVANPRSTCLISRNLLNQKQPSSLGSDASSILENPQLDSESVSGSCGKMQRGPG